MIDDHDDHMTAPDYRYADRRITELLDELIIEGVCPRCIGHVMVVKAAAVCDTANGSAHTAKLFSAAAAMARERNEPAVPVSDDEVRH